MLEALAANTLKSADIGEPPPAEFGWCAGRHVFDEDFTAENCIVGNCLLFGLRIDTNRVPAELKRAYRAMAEAAAGSEAPAGFLSRREKRAAKEEADERCRRELADGRHRKSKMIEVLWDVERGILLAPAFADAVVAGLRDLFASTFDLKLQPLSSGALAYDLLAGSGRGRDYEDLKPALFGPPPAAAADHDDVSASGGRPAVPWAHATPEASDFIGNEFLLWLWWAAEARSAARSGAAAEIDYALERTLEMECAWGVTGKQALQSDAPSRSPEALRGLQNGKWPRKTGLLLASDAQQWAATLQADRFLLSGVKLPQPEEDVASPQELIEFRIESTRTVDRAMVALFESFLADRTSATWSPTRSAMAEWIARRPRAVASAGASIEVKPEAEAEHALTV